MDIIYTLIKIIAGGAILLGGISLAIVIISAIVSKFNKKLVDKAVDKLDNAIDYLEKMEKPSKRAKKIFPNLKGVDFDSISQVPDGQSPIEYIKSKNDGGWYFSIQNFAMIIKSFSDENYEKGLADLLHSNNLDSNLINEESSHFYYQGNGFNIEKPKTKDINLLVISNENLFSKTAINFRQDTELNEIKVDWVNGIEKVYQGDDALKRFDLENHLANIALHFIDKEDKFEYLTIHIRTHNLAPKIIDKIIDENGGDEKFEKLNDRGNWKNLYQCNDFVIGYLPQHRCVRLNQITKLYSKIEGHRLIPKSIKELEDKNGIGYYQGEKFTGTLIYSKYDTFRIEGEFKDGIRIRENRYFGDGSLRYYSEVVNGIHTIIKEWAIIKESVVRTSSVFNFAEDRDFDQIDNIEELKKKYIKKVQDLHAKATEFDPSEYQNALELYKQKFLEAQSRIKGIVNKVSEKSVEQANEVNKIYKNEVAEETNEERKNKGAKRVLVREYKDGKIFGYYYNGNIKWVKDVIPEKNNFDPNQTFTEISYYENGKISDKCIFKIINPELYFNDHRDNDGVETVEDKGYYESGKLKRETVIDGKYEITTNFFKNGKVESTNLNDKFLGYTYYLASDKKRNKLTKQAYINAIKEKYEQHLKEEEAKRKYLNSDDFIGKSDDEEGRMIYKHAINTKGDFLIQDKFGKWVKVSAQKHILELIDEFWDDENQEWCEGDYYDIVDEFYLTGYEEGHRFYEEDLKKLFELNYSPSNYEWNGYSTCWSGIEDDDSPEDAMKKWDDYKKSFPRITSINQLDIRSRKV